MATTACVRSRRSWLPQKSGTFWACFFAATLVLIGTHSGFGQSAHFSVAQTRLLSNISSPGAVAVDSAGFIYFADAGSVYKVLSKSGAYTSSIVASGFADVEGIAVDPAGNVYVSDAGQNRVMKELVSSGSYTPAVVTADVSSPSGLAIDAAGNLYIADKGHGQVLEASPIGQTYSLQVLATGLASPGAIARDNSGTLYIAEYGRGDVLAEVPSQGGYAAVPVASGFQSPVSLAVDSSGSLFIADSHAPRFLEESPAPGGQYKEILLGNGVSSAGGLAISPSGTLIVSDRATNSLSSIQTRQIGLGNIQIGLTTQPTSFFFTFDAGGPLSTSSPYSLLTQGAVGSDFTDAGTGSCTTNGLGYTYANRESCSVDVVFTPRFAGRRAGSVILTASDGSRASTISFSANGQGPQISFSPAAMAPALTAVPDGTQSVRVDGRDGLYVTGNHTLTKSTPSGSSYATTTIASDLHFPQGIALLPNGDLFIADTGNNRIVKETWSPSGYTESIAVSGLQNPWGIAVSDDEQRIFVSQPAHVDFDSFVGPDNLLELTPSQGGYTQTVIADSLAEPSDVALDPTGVVYVADQKHGVVLKLTPAEISYSKSSIPGFSRPFGLAFDSTGNLFVSDSDTNTIYRLAYDGSHYQTAVIQHVDNAFWVAVGVRGTIYNSNIYRGTVYRYIRGLGPTLVFAPGVDGYQSEDSPKSVTIENIGNQDLFFPVLAGISNPRITNPAFSFDAASTTCSVTDSAVPAVLSPGQNCILGIDFGPVSNGGIFGEVDIVDTAFNGVAPDYSQQSILLVGSSSPGSPSVLSLTGVPPTLGLGGSLGQITVSLNDKLGNRVLTGAAHIVLSLSGPDGFHFTVENNAAAGVSLFDLTTLALPSSGSYLLTASAPNLASATASVAVGHPAGFVITGLQALITAGQQVGPFMATIVDQYGNTVPSPPLAITASLSGPAAYSATTSVPAGSHATSIILPGTGPTTAGTYTLTVSAPGVGAYSSTLAVIAAPAAKLSISSLPSSLKAGGNPGIVGVLFLDVYGNLAGSAASPLTMAIRGPNGYSQQNTCFPIHGTCNLDLSGSVLTQVGSYTASANSSPLPPASSSLVVVASDPSQVVITGVVSLMTVGDSFGKIATMVEDAYGNASSSRVALSATISGPERFHVTLPAWISNGKGMIDLTGEIAKQAGSYTITVSGTGLTPAIATTVAIAAPEGQAPIVPTPPAFEISSPDPGSAAPAAVSPGSTVSYPLVVATVSGTIKDPVTFTVAGLPPGATATFAPASVSLGNSPATTTLTIQTAPRTFALLTHTGGSLLLSAAMVTLILPASRRSLLALRSSTRNGLLCTIFLAPVLAGLAGCGITVIRKDTAYPVTVTAQSGAQSSFTTVVLVIQ